MSSDPPTNEPPKQRADHELSDPYAGIREKMVTGQLARRDIVNQRVLDAMRTVHRHEFVPEHLKSSAYDDSPLPIGKSQTISQPYIVALMTQLVDPQPDDKVLDVGTGSGYQAAVLAPLVQNIFSIEIVKSLADDADARLRRLGYKNVVVRHGDGYNGWPDEAPFDVIIVAAAPDHIPQALVDQLAPGGAMVIPVGDRSQKLMMVSKEEDGTVVRDYIAPVAFVPMTGEARD
ncbi:MAG: protein-L-isoaspartate(D-aspartate) O-methyltransferase [Pirellulaceae bacterium]|nr:protein-L-isoaspartate(D-aspartate) O-methyltransferase [Pirellulaceae bacterium]